MDNLSSYAGFYCVIICLVAWSINADDQCYKNCICGSIQLNCTGLTQQDLESDKFLGIIAKKKYNHIHITDGDIPTLPKNILGSDVQLTNLVKLDLQNNGIKIIHGQNFHHMPNLEELNLAINQWNVSANHARVFTRLPKLRKLNLTNAFHEGVEAEIHLTHLQEVFSYNESLNNLEVLSLDDNRFSVFDINSSKALCSLPALKRLNLANNLLPKITLYPKNDCFLKLEHIDLSYNNINSFEDYTHNGLLYRLDFIQSASPNLTVNFWGNEFDCDCGLLEFHNWLHRTRVHVTKKTKYICHDGLHFNQTVYKLRTTDFQCFSLNTSTSSNRAVVGVLVTMFVLIALVLIVIAYLKRNTIKQFVTSFRKPSLAREHLFGYSSVNNENATDIEV